MQHKKLTQEIQAISRFLWVWFLSLLWITLIAILGFTYNILLYIALFFIIEFCFLAIYLGINASNKTLIQAPRKDLWVQLLTLFALFITFCAAMIIIHWGTVDSFRYTPMNYQCESAESTGWYISGLNSLICLATQWWLFRKIIWIIIIPAAIVLHVYYVKFNGLKKNN